MSAYDAGLDAEKRFPYRISEWYLLRHELAREEGAIFLSQICNLIGNKDGFPVLFFDLTHLSLLVMMNFLENFV
jgi:hypothetical protein